MALPVVCYLSLGSNVGDKAGYLAKARAKLAEAEGISVLRASPLYLTRPVGKTDQDWFLNQVLEIATTLGAYELLAVCQKIELELGRVRHERWGPRTLDIDIIVYGDMESADPELTLPHPRALERAFVLVPLADLRPDLLIGGVPVTEHLRRLPGGWEDGVQPFREGAD